MKAAVMMMQMDVAEPSVGKASIQPSALKRFPTLRKNSFLCQLQAQAQTHMETKTQRERQNEGKKIQRILQKSPEVRDAQEIDTLYEWALVNGSINKIFQGAQEVICKTICREMTLLELPSHGVVCYQGDYGDTFYIIITGSVSLFLNANPKPKFVLDEDNHSKLYDEEVKLKPEEYGTFIKHITDGGTFGELAVMDPTTRRSCTITCDEPTSFICLKRGAYQRLIRMTNSSQLDFTQIEFLETMYFFDGWPHNELTRLSNRLRHMNFPADSYLSRIGADANVVFLIYAGLVQETVPMIQVRDENGSVRRCAELESNLARRQMQRLGGKQAAQQVHRIEMELSLYQDHDICGEYPIFFNRPTYSTDLLAVTDVKTLIMDRETWNEIFYTHALDHIRESFSKLRKIADARENWRKTRVKLALANPGLLLTISTKAMMQEGKCLCGWCGNSDHTTGDACCPGLAASKKKLKDQEKQAHATKTKKQIDPTAALQTANDGSPRSVDDPTARTKTVVASTKSTTIVPCAFPIRLLQEEVVGPKPPCCSAPHRLRRSGIKVIAQNAMPTKTAVSMNQVETVAPDTSSKKPEGKELASQLKEGVSSSTDTRGYSKDPVTDFPKLQKTLSSLHPKEQHFPELDDKQTLPAIKVEDVRKEAFTESLADQYKHEMVRKVKRLSSMEQYIRVRGKVLGDIIASQESHEHCRLPRKAKIPRPSRQLVNPKTRQPRPDRFNRKINRMMRKIWRKDHQLPVVEESLRDP